MLPPVRTRRQLTLVVAFALFVGGGCTRAIGEEEAARLALDLYAPSGGSLEVMQVRSVAGLYKVTLRAPRGNYIDVYLSADGTRFSEQFASVAEERAGRARDKRFADCLAAAGVSLLIDHGERSAAQVRDLGRFAHTLAIPCDSDMDNCRALGVTELPTTRHGKELHAGRHTLGWYETLTGCKR